MSYSVMNCKVGDSNNLCDDREGGRYMALPVSGSTKAGSDNLSSYLMCPSLMVRVPFCVKVLVCLCSVA